MLYFNYGDESNYEVVDGVPHFTDAFSNDTRGMDTMLKTYTGHGRQLCHPAYAGFLQVQTAGSAGCG